MTKAAPKPTRPDIARLLEFQIFLLRFQAIKRMVHIPRDHQPENDVEHSYSLAMTAWFLASFFPELDADKAIRLALVHDLVEVYAGDTYAYADQTTLDSKQAREAKALRQLKEDWPDFPEMTQLIHSYEKRTSAEAKFVYALDKIMPPMLIYLGDGYTWKKQGITLKMHHQSKIDKVTASPEVNDYYEQLYAIFVENPDLFSPTKHQGK